MKIKTNTVVFLIDTWNKILFVPDKKPADGLEWFVERIDRAVSMILELVVN